MVKIARVKCSNTSVVYKKGAITYNNFYIKKFQKLKFLFKIGQYGYIFVSRKYCFPFNIVIHTIVKYSLDEDHTIVYVYHAVHVYHPACNRGQTVHDK